MSSMSSTAARRLGKCPRDPLHRVAALSGLIESGWTDSGVRAQLRAHRWQRFGRAVVLHNGTPSAAEVRRIAVLNCGPRAVLTAFSAAEEFGLRGWEREPTHVLVPGGAHIQRVPGLQVRAHYTARWDTSAHLQVRGLHRAAPALVLAASTFARPRPACGILAAGVQQRLVTASALRDALMARTRLRHRRVLMLAVDDIAQGAQALSEIDFARLCRRHRLPEPIRQAVRIEPDGRRRYLDAEWIRYDGRRVVAEIDGALHLAPRRWWNDQLRQNELVIMGDLLLRYPSIVIRTEEETVVGQLRRVLQP